MTSIRTEIMNEQRKPDRIVVLGDVDITDEVSFLIASLGLALTGEVEKARKTSIMAINSIIGKTVVGKINTESSYRRPDWLSNYGADLEEE